MNNIEYLLGKDLKLNTNQDIIFNIDLIVTNNYECIIQKIINKLRSFPQSLYLNPNWGGLLQSNLGKPMSISYKDRMYELVKNELLEEPEIDSINQINVSIDKDRGIFKILLNLKLRGSNKPISLDVDYTTVYKDSNLYINNLINYTYKGL